ncbi:MAG TPA: DinB family protein [Bryobacteraceae bacterium]|jgi:hypothetical protein
MLKIGGSLFVLGVAAFAGAQSKAPSAADVLKQNFDYVNQKILTMAQDFPEAKYEYRLKPEMRSFREVVVHIASGNVYAAKAGRGEKVKWDELPPADYKTKAECVALTRKWIDEANAALKASPEGWHGSLDPFLSVLQHTSEHYGLLVAYYRANGLVPPESRPKK